MRFVFTTRSDAGIVQALRHYSLHQVKVRGVRGYWNVLRAAVESARLGASSLSPSDSRNAEIKRLLTTIFESIRIWSVLLRTIMDVHQSSTA